MAVDLPPDRRIPTRPDRELLEMFAVQAGVALSNARERERLIERRAPGPDAHGGGRQPAPQQGLTEALGTSVVAVAECLGHRADRVRSSPPTRGQPARRRARRGLHLEHDVPRSARTSTSPRRTLPRADPARRRRPASAAAARAARSRMQELMRGMRSRAARSCARSSRRTSCRLRRLGVRPPRPSPDRQRRPTPCSRWAACSRRPSAPGPRPGDRAAPRPGAPRARPLPQRAHRHDLARAQDAADLDPRPRRAPRRPPPRPRLGRGHHPQRAAARPARRQPAPLLARPGSSRARTPRRRPRRAVRGQRRPARLPRRAGGRRLSFTRRRPTRSSSSGDPEELGRVIDNIVDNAVKYTPEDGAVAGRDDGRTPSRPASVTDTGLGISLADQSHLFSAFHRSTNPDALSLPGHRPRPAHRPRIAESARRRPSRSTSELGVGSTFSLRLPRQAAALLRLLTAPRNGRRPRRMSGGVSASLLVRRQGQRSTLNFSLVAAALDRVGTPVDGDQLVLADLQVLLDLDVSLAVFDVTVPIFLPSSRTSTLPVTSRRRQP